MLFSFNCYAAFLFLLFYVNHFVLHSIVGKVLYKLNFIWFDILILQPTVRPQLYGDNVCFLQKSITWIPFCLGPNNCHHWLTWVTALPLGATSGAGVETSKTGGWKVWDQVEVPLSCQEGSSFSTMLPKEDFSILWSLLLGVPGCWATVAPPDQWWGGSSSAAPPILIAHTELITQTKQSCS